MFNRRRRQQEKTRLAERRFLTRDGRSKIRRVGISRDYRKDWYHWLLTLRTTHLLAVVTLAYLALNLLFGWLYYIDPNGLRGAHALDFADDFFFSVQTLATIGYGRITPESFYANCIVTLETVVAMATVALFTGLLFSKFARPTASVMFTPKAVISLHDGIQTLMFRVANRRGNNLLEANVRVTLARNEKTLEGEAVRRLYDLELVRDTNSFFSLSWTVMHKITHDSPLYNRTADDLVKSETQLVVLISGTDEGFNQTVHARGAYHWDDIKYGYRFQDVLRHDADNHLYVDFNYFNEIIPAIE